VGTPPALAARGGCVVLGLRTGAPQLPKGFKVRKDQALATALRATEGRVPADATPQVGSACGEWRIRLVSRGVVEGDVAIDGRSGRLLSAWTGYQVHWPLSRGSGTLFVGRGFPVILVILCVLFIAPFVDPRRPLRALHFDLLALVALGVSLVPFARGDLEWSTPLSFAALAWLLARLVWLGLRPPQRPGPLCPRLSPNALAIGAGVLLAGRAVYVALVAHVSDVGYYSVFGAQAILDGFPVYASSAVDLAAYGPATHFAYLPFTALFPLPGGVARGGDEAARAASITFDVLIAVVLYAIGRRMRPGRSGHALGAALAFAWAANPLGFYPVATATNDALVGLLVVASLLFIRSPVGRGALTGLAAAAKWVPLVILPVLAAGRSSLRGRDAVIVGLSAAAAILVMALPLMPDGGPREMYDVAIGDLASVHSPFTPWGLWELPTWPRHVLVALVGLSALALAFVPRTRTIPQVAALAAALLVAIQLTLPHWIYWYAAWWLPIALVAMLAYHDTDGEVEFSAHASQFEVEDALVS